MQGLSEISRPDQNRAYSEQLTIAAGFDAEDDASIAPVTSSATPKSTAGPWP